MLISAWGDRANHLPKDRATTMFPKEFIGTGGAVIGFQVEEGLTLKMQIEIFGKSQNLLKNNHET